MKPRNLQIILFTIKNNNIYKVEENNKALKYCATIKDKVFSYR